MKSLLKQVRYFFNIWKWAFSLSWKASKKSVIGIVSTAILSSLIPFLLALYIRGLINIFIIQIENSNTDIEPLLPWIIIGFVLTLVDAASSVINIYFVKRIEDEANLFISVLVIEKSQELKLSFFEDPKSQDTLTHVRYLAARRMSQIVGVSANLFKNTIQTLSLVLLLLYIQPVLAIIFIGLVIPYGIYQWQLTNDGYLKQKKKIEDVRWAGYYIREALSPEWLAETKLLDLVPIFKKKYAERSENINTVKRKIYARMMWSYIIFTFFAIIGIYGLFFYVAQSVLLGALTVGDITVYTGATAKLRTSFNTTVTNINVLREILFYCVDTKSYLELEASNKVIEVAKNDIGSIELKNISYRYPNTDKNVIDNLSLKIKKGEVIALVGKNGSGKTTLVKLIAKLYEATNGSIEIEGLKGNNAASWHQCISFVFQRPNLYETTVLENISYGDWRYYENKKGKSTEIEEIIKEAGTEKLIQKMPNGIHTNVGLNFADYKPSIGEIQNLAITRAFAHKNSAIIILDEPTASLDASTELELFNKLKLLANNRTTIFISHRLSTTKLADRIIVLDKGRIIEEGKHEDLLGKKGLYSQLYHLQKQMNI